MSLPGHAHPTGYRRDLNIGRAVAGVAYQAGGVTYRREVFASHPDQVIVGRLTTDKPGMYTGTIGLTGTHGEAVIVNDQGLMFSGTLDNGERYESQLRAVNDGGAFRPSTGDLLSGLRLPDLLPRRRHRLCRGSPPKLER